MKLKDSNKDNPIVKKIRDASTSRIVVIIVVIIIIPCYSGAVFLVGALAHRAGHVGLVKRALLGGLRVPFNYIIGSIASVERMTIDIKHMDFQKLAYQREVALAKGILIVGDDDYVPATIRYKDGSLKAKLRLKGDWVHDSLKKHKWSFRIRIKGDNTFFGMKQFSIHHPGAREYIYEWIFHKALRREGVLALRYRFIKVILNGRDWGIYALEEHFEKRLIEYNQLREGPIVRFNENLFWDEYSERLGQSFLNAKWSGCNTYLSSDVDTFHTNIMLSEPSRRSEHDKAIHLVESFRRGLLKTSEAFDIEKLAAYFAITDLMGTEHGSRWHNIRFYYNPITSRLEPIGFDGYGEGSIAIESLCAFRAGTHIDFDSPQIHSHYAMIFSDPMFFQEYVRILERISDSSYLDKLFAELSDELEENLSIIYKEFPYFLFSKNDLYQNQRYIRTILNPVKGVHAYYHKLSENKIELELGSIQSMPIEVLGVSYQDSLLFQPVRRIILPSKIPSDPVDYENVRFILPQDFVWSDTMVTDLKLRYRIFGTSRIRYENVFPWSYLDDNFVESDFIRQKPNVLEFDFLVMDKSTKTIFVRPGSWNLDRNLIIPKGYRVVCGESTQLNLSNSAKILSYSPFEFVGSEEAPISIRSADPTGQGIAVMSADQRSVLDYVIFGNLSSPSQSGWELTGAITFYESPVDISHCQFVGSRAEDSLNIVRSEFMIDRTIFSEPLSDAFDSDFAKGKITNSSFVDCGNDAIDVSGSAIELQNVFVNGTGDKALSVGEHSQATVNQIEVRNAEIALASKDTSKIAIEDVNISDCKVSFAVYQKKPEFGPASITVTNLEESGNTTPYLVEEGSSLVIDGVAIQSNHRNVEEILYGAGYGKDSK